MGKSLLKFVLVCCAMFVAGLLYMDWGSFEYTVPDKQPTYFNPDGSPVR